MSTCALSRDALARRVAELKQTTLAERFVTGAKTAMLATATSAERHVLGVAMLQGWRGIVAHPMEVGTDYLRSLATGTDRTKSLVLTARGIRTYIGGFAHGTKDMAEAMKHGYDPETSLSSFSLDDRAPLKTPMLETARRYINTFVTARNKPFAEGSMRVNMLEQAQALATREGLAGQQWGARVNELVASPTDQMTVNAMAATAKSLLADRSVTAKFVSNASDYFKREMTGGSNLTRAERAQAQARMEGLTGDAVHDRVAQLLGMKPADFERTVRVPKQKSGGALSQTTEGRAAATAGYVATNLLAPFPKIGANIAATSIDYSPLGLLKTAFETAHAAKGDRLNTAIGGLTKAAAGSATWMAVGHYLYAHGLATGALPTSAGEQEQWKLEGKTPYSVKVAGRWRSLDTGSPVTMMPIMGIAMAEEQAKQPNQMGLNLLRSQGAYIVEVTKRGILGAMRGLGDASGGDPRAAAQLASGVVPVPPVLGQAARAIDRTKRDTKDANPFKQAAKEVASRVPGLSQTLPPQLTQFGQPIQYGTSGPSNAAEQFLDASRPVPDRATALTNEMDRIGVTVGRAGTAEKIGLVKVTRTPDEQRAFLEAEGPALQRHLEDLVVSPEYQHAAMPTQASMMRATIKAWRGAFRSQDILTRYRKTPTAFTTPQP
jgi:hypothetical protein